MLGGGGLIESGGGEVKDASVAVVHQPQSFFPIQDLLFENGQKSSGTRPSQFVQNLKFFS